MAEQADAQVSKTCDGNIMWVRFPLPALMRRKPKKVIRWSFELAYAVGLITTDGNLSKDNRHITLTSTDRQLLCTFKCCLGKNNRITENTPTKRFRKKAFKVQLSDVTFYDFLIKIGLFPNKSLTIGELKIPQKYFVDFLRGHLDGDGSIIYYKDRYNSYLNPKYVYDRLFIYFISASKKHVKWLQKNIIKLKKIHGNIECLKFKTKTNNPFYRLKFSTKEAKIILNSIYYKNNLPCLLRKYQIAKPFLVPSSLN